MEFICRRGQHDEEEFEVKARKHLFAQGELCLVALGALANEKTSVADEVISAKARKPHG